MRSGSDKEHLHRQPKIEPEAEGTAKTAGQDDRDLDGLAYRTDDGRDVWKLYPVKMHADAAFALRSARS